MDHYLCYLFIHPNDFVAYYMHLLLMSCFLGCEVAMASLAATSIWAVVLVISLCLTCVDASTTPVYHLGGSDKEILERKVQCYQDIDNGLWGDACKATAIDKENCALACVSTSCYNSVYGSDPLEEGEVDMKRGRQFKACIQGQLKGERQANARSATT